MHFWLLPCLEQALFIMIIILRHNPGLLYFHIHLCRSFIRNLWQQIQYSFCWDPSFPDHGFCNWRVFNKRYNVATYSFVTMFFFSVDGNYTEWSEFQACSVTCGKGIQARSRSCTNPPPQHGGKNCSAYGRPVETKECNLRECPSKDISKFLLSVNM